MNNLFLLVIKFDESTPECDSISPKFGSVLGGEIITISGSKFSTNKDDYEIYFDNIKV